ncbi:MAG: GNAT family N-acetyltransferase [Actinomycetales bacterium]
MDRPTADASVRDATAADATAIGQVQAAAWRSSYQDVLPAATLSSLQVEDLAEAWREAIVRPPGAGHRVLVAAGSEGVVGFVAIAPAAESVPETGEIAALVVAPSAQGSGHGSRLLNAAVDRLRLQGFERVLVWVLEKDEARLRFLSGAGFADDGGRRTFATDDGRAELREVRLAASLRDDG